MAAAKVKVGRIIVIPEVQSYEGEYLGNGEYTTPESGKGDWDGGYEWFLAETPWATIVLTDDSYNVLHADNSYPRKQFVTALRAVLRGREVGIDNGRTRSALNLRPCAIGRKKGVLVTAPCGAMFFVPLKHARQVLAALS